jgi:hypothetical protein
MSGMALGDESRIDLVTGKTIHKVKASADRVREAVVQGGGAPLVRIPTDPPMWLNPAHIVTIQDTDPNSVPFAAVYG